MANLNYWMAQSLLNPNHNPLITFDFEGFIDEQWYPYHDSMVSVSPVFALTTHYPVEANGRAIQYIKTNSYFDDYYNRIHISPASLELGNVASEQVSTVNLWNAYLVPKTLQSIDGIEEGLDVSGQPNVPLKFAALQERTWNISILPDGPSTIDVHLTWQFSSDQAVLHITGTRIVAFSWLIDWAKPVNETLQWLTDILQSQSGYEQRRSMRVAPRITFDADILVYDRERQYFDLAMIGWGAKTFAMPVWPQQQWLKQTHSIGTLIIYCDTTNRNFRANRLAILRGETAFQNETLEIESVFSDRLILKRPLQQNWPRGTCLSPAVTVQLNDQPQLTKRTDRMMRTHVTLNVTEPVDHPEALPTLTYRNYPVLSDAPNEQDDLTHSYERLLNQLDNKTGLRLQKDNAQAAFSIFQYAWMTSGRVAQSNLRSLFYALRGSQKAIWLPTFSDDLTVKAVIVASGQTFDIQWCGYTRFARGQLGRQDIQIILKNGTILYRRITSATEVDAATERLAVDQNFPTQINPNDIFRISFMNLCRLSNDTVVFEHINDSDGIAKCSATFRGVRES
ncbi:hypothetical protein [Acinetobacter ursingii]|uniref:hypothetical protein n=1 Tax=Acinetobacter ursingii TaxID=108980 RepID=UPI0021CD8936|nr:hypothetical protein [Acinetobacter ursingii]MCU4601855.1 hypothetical protein [Acinetobacter ursingii]